MRRLDRIRLKIHEAMSKDLYNAVKAFAKEDMGYAKKEGSMAITDTKKGVVELSFADNTYTLTDRSGKVLLKTPSAQAMEKFLIEDIYDIEED